MEQERFYGQMLDHVRTGILVEEDGKVIYTNKAANDTLGLPALGHIRQLEGNPVENARLIKKWQRMLRKAEA